MPTEDAGQKSDQTAEIKPRKKKCVVKRKAGSPLNDTDYTNNTNNTRVSSKAGGKGKGKGKKASNVSKNSSQYVGFPFPDPKSNPFTTNFNSHELNTSLVMDSTDPNQAASAPHPGQLIGSVLSSMSSPSNVQGQQAYNIPPPQASVTPNWLPELINDVKHIKLSLTKLDQIEKTVNTIHMKVTDLENKVNVIEPRVTEVEKSCSFISDENDNRKKELDRAKSEIVKLKYDCTNMKTDADMLRQKNAALESKVTDLESRSMRDNLLFYGIPERGQHENCEELIKQVCVETLELEEAETMKFDRVHRIGMHSTSKIRPIVAKFHYFKEREQVRQKAYEKSNTLKSANMGIGKQWPSEVRDTRRALFPIMQREKSNGKNVKLVKDKLYVNDIEYKLSAQEKWHAQNPQPVNYAQGPHMPPQFPQNFQPPATGYHTGYPVQPPGQAPTTWGNVPSQHLTSPQCMPPNMQRMPQPPQYIPQQDQRMPQPMQHMPLPAQHMPQPAQHMPQPAQHMPQPAQRMPQPAQRMPQPTQQTPSQSTPQTQGQTQSKPVPPPQEMHYSPV